MHEFQIIFIFDSFIFAEFDLKMEQANFRYQAAMLLIARTLYQELQQRRVRSFGVRPIFKRRIRFGDGHNLLEELRFGDAEFFFIYTRMNTERLL